MAYGSTKPQLVRLVQGGKVYKPFLSNWECDPCALPGRRYRLEAIKDGKGEWLEQAFWDVILPEDNARTRYIKWTQNKAMAELSDNAWRLEQQRRNAVLYGPKVSK